MTEDEVFDIIKDVYFEENFEINKAKYAFLGKPNYTSFRIKKYNNKFKGFYTHVRIQNKVLGNQILNDHWVVIGCNISNEYEIDFDSVLSLQMFKDWFDELLEAEKKVDHLKSRFNKMKRNFKSELRDYQLKKLL
jgi:hypothetical protein